LRFRLTSDGGLQMDGWRFDDVRVLVYPEDTTDSGPQTTQGSPAVGLALTSANPCRDAAQLRATFGRTTAFRAAVYRVNGRLVRLLGTGMAAPGSRDLVWDGRDASGRRAAAGTYLVRLDAGGTAVQKRVVLVH
jgi:hypothetical protein